jgi:outer membrane protein assembly factor BamE (lipoprotein component of BamABCDE complex)
MKKTLAMYLLVCITAFSLCSCASNNGQTAENGQAKPAKKEKPPKDKRSKEERLSVGMTMDQVVEAIGKPRDKSVSSDGSQVWTYNDWAKAAAIAYWSPVGAKVHMLTVVFGTDGKVKSWASSSRHEY